MALDAKKVFAVLGGRIDEIDGTAAKEASEKAREYAAEAKEYAESTTPLDIEYEEDTHTVVFKGGNVEDYNEIIVLLTGVRDALKEDDPEKAINLLDNFLLDKGCNQFR